MKSGCSPQVPLRSYLALASAIASIVLSGCAVLSPKTPEQRVTERAQLWMDAMIAMDYDTAWELVSPGYRSQWAIGNYRARYRGAAWWLEGEMGSVECDRNADEAGPTECTAILYITYDAPMVNMTNRRTFTTRWLKSSGDWYKFER